MSTALITHPACLRHEPPPGHPERGQAHSTTRTLWATEIAECDQEEERSQEIR